MDKIVVMVGLAMIVVAVFGVEREPAPTERTESIQLLAPPPEIEGAVPSAGNGFARFTARRAPDGHFYADVRINGATSRMLIDTGATSILLTRDDARRAGIQARSGEFTATGQTAGGTIALKPVRIDRVALGPVSSRDVPAMVAEHDLDISLLGQSFLERVGTVEISGDEMTLR